MLCDCRSKYVYVIKLWNGNKNTLLNIVKDLTKGLEYSNHHLIIDNLYNSYETSRELFSKGFYTTGTLRKRRGGPFFMNLPRVKSAPKKSIFPFSKTNVNCFIYYDSKPVTLILTYFDLSKDVKKTSIDIHPNNSKITGLILENKPTIINEYNKLKGGVDVVDQELKYYTSQRKSDRWTFKFSIHLLQTILFNSFILYKKKYR